MSDTWRYLLLELIPNSTTKHSIFLRKLSNKNESLREHTVDERKLENKIRGKKNLSEYKQETDQ